MTTKLIFSALLFILALLSGFWLSKTGRPLNTAIFTIHKLSVIGGIILAFFVFIPFSKSQGIDAMGISLLIVSLVLLVTSFVSGALMSFDRFADTFVHSIHKVTPIITLFPMSITVWYFAKM